MLLIHYQAHVFKRYTGIQVKSYFFWYAFQNGSLRDKVSNHLAFIMGKRTTDLPIHT